MANLDFKNADPKLYAGINFYGILEGRGHTIKNMYIPKSVNACLFGGGNYNTKILNLNIKNYNLEKAGGNAGIFGGGNGITLKNVNIDIVNITADGSTSVGTISSGGNNFEFEDITLNNVNIIVKNALAPKVGGFVGNGIGNINNAYANNLNIKVENSREDTMVGGIIGNGYSAIKDISNVIIKGNIETNSGKVGGIIGAGDFNINNSIIKMNIVADGNMVGGLIGHKQNTAVEIKNNLYIGNIANKKDTKYMGALFGRYSAKGTNYIYDKNKINNVIVADNYKLGIEELQKENTYRKILNFGDNFNYDDLNNKLPLLKNSDNSNVLPNQSPIYIEEKDVDIKTVSTLREDGNRLKVRLEITNPKNLEIEKVIIENMDLEITEKRNKNGITYIDLIAIPTKYYDNYHITEIKYIKDDKEYSQNTQYLIEEAFYKEITKFEDWQNIEKESYENYRLLTDLDFTGKQNINYNVKIGRLVTEGKIHTIKNLTLNIRSGTSGLISILKNGIENIKFENININVINESQGTSINYAGIIGRCEGDIKNIEFNNININITGQVLGIGCIGIYEGIFIDTVKTNNIYIVDKTSHGRSAYIGGTFGFLKYGEAKNIEGNNINIDANVKYVGGIIGYMTEITGSPYTSNIKIENSNIKGNNAVGGVVGQGGFTENITVSNCTIEGNENVGGVVGSQAYYDGGLENTLVTDSYIKGVNYVGGIFGGGGRIANAKVLNSTIEGISSNSVSVGGIVGQEGWIPNGSYIKNSKVISKGINVGGIVGKSGSGVAQGYAENVLVEGYANVGGIAGYANQGGISGSYTNADVIATEHSAGGIVGQLNNEGMDNINKVSQIFKNYYAGGTIQGKEYVGGIIGEAVEELYMPEKYYRLNYVEANLISENDNTTSLGIGNRQKSNGKLEKTCYYKYSKINGKYPTKENEPYIPSESYLVEEELKQESTYKTKLGWDSAFSYRILAENKYPLIVYAGKILEGQDGIAIPEDPVLEETSENLNNSDNKDNDANSKNEMLNNFTEEDIIQDLNKEGSEKLQYIFNYEGKIIKTYETYSEIESEDGGKVVRKGIRLYAKDGKLYALPVSLEFGGNVFKLVANNFVIDSYNGKEYETVLGEDGRLYDLKTPIKYPENFINEGIKSIGNNLHTEDFTENFSGNDINEIGTGIFSQKEIKNEHEVEIVYKNGDKLKFNYQTGEIISSSKGEQQPTTETKEISLLDYIQEHFSKVRNYTNTDKTNIEMQNKYEETLKLENKLEKTQVEEAIKKQKAIDNKKDLYIEENKSVDNNINSSTDEVVKIEENNQSNNSLKETKYISMYSADKDDYQIYQEEELLDTSKQEVISENEKIEANNLKEYYASEGEAKNTKMGIVWIALSIIGVVIILFAIKKRD